jgi:hypothetical protein
MPVTKKLANWMSKKIKDTPKTIQKGDPRYDKEGLKADLLMVEMTKLSKKELEELAKKPRSKRGEAALDEMERRLRKKDVTKKGTYKDERENPVYDTKTGARLSDALSASDIRKEIEDRAVEAKQRGFAKGGVVKKPAAKKPAVKKPIKKGK